MADFLSLFTSTDTGLRTLAPPAAESQLSLPTVRKWMRGAVRSMFNSASTNRLTGDWSTTPQPADWIIRKHQRTLVARSREESHNNDYMKAYLRLCRQNIVGASGIVFQSKAAMANGKADAKSQKAVEAWFRDWCKPANCDAAGKLSWRAMQAHCVTTAAKDGEFFLRMITGDDGGKYGFALQVLDPVRCPVDLDVDNRDGTFVRHGIEFNSYGRPVAYFFLDESARRADQAYTFGGRNYKRIPADEIVHGFVVEMVGQKRGLPWLSTGLFRMKQMGAFEDAAVVNARVGAAKMGFITYKDGFGPEADDEPLQIDAEAGAMVELPEGAEFAKFDPLYPAGEFAVFMKQMLRSLSTGGGVSYHALAQDLEGVNFSSIRQGTLDEREFYMDRQEWLIDELCDKVVDAALRRALLGGHVTADNGKPLAPAGFSRYLPHNFQPRRWSWVDPAKDVEAAVASKNNLLKSPGQLIREAGDDPENVWLEIGQDIAAMRASGIPENIIEMAMGLKLAPPSQQKPPKEDEA